MATPETAILSVTQPVEDQERALAFSRDVLGFEVRRDMTVGSGARWIEVAPPGSATTVALVDAGSGVPSASGSGRRTSTRCARRCSAMRSTSTTP